MDIETSQSEDLSRFSSRYFPPFIFPSILTSPQHDAATTMLRSRYGDRFPPDVMLGIQAKEFNLGFIKPVNLVSHGLRVFR